MAFKVQAPFHKFIGENDATPVASTFTEFQLKSKRPGASPDVLKFYDRDNGVDAAPDTMSWGGETEVNVEYFAKDDTRNVQVGRNLDDDIIIEGRLLGKNATFNANVLNGWRMTRDRCELTWNGLKYEVMIQKTNFKEVDTFEVEFSVTFKVIRNLTFAEAKPTGAVTTAEMRGRVAALQGDVAELDQLQAHLDLLTKKTILNSGFATDAVNFFGKILGAVAVASELMKNFINEVSAIIDTSQRIISAPRKVLANLSSTFSKARAATQRLVDLVRGVGNLPGDVAIAVQDMGNAALGVLTGLTTGSTVIPTAPPSSGSLTGAASPAGAKSLSYNARRGAARAAMAQARMQDILNKMKPRDKEYRVKAGDSLRSIARQYNISTHDLLNANPRLRFPHGVNPTVPNPPVPTTLKTGVVLTIPARPEE